MATLTLTIPDPQVPRVQAAFGEILELIDGNGDRRDATAEEVRVFLVGKLKQYVRSQEARAASDAAGAAVTDVDVT